jgi:predicted lipase
METLKERIQYDREYIDTDLDICHPQKLYPTEEIKKEFRTDKAIKDYLHSKGYDKVEIQGGYDRLTYIMIYVFKGTESDFHDIIDTIILK